MSKAVLAFALALALALGACSADGRQDELERQREIAFGWYEFFLDCGAIEATLAMMEDGMNQTHAVDHARIECWDEYAEQQYEGFGPDY